MNFDTLLPFLIPGEIIFALILALLFTINQIIKQRRKIKKLLAKFREINSLHEHQNKDAVSFYNLKSPPERADTITDYFTQSLADSLQRYEKYTSSKQPHLDYDHPYSGKIAALRSIYLAAEKEVFEERGITHAGWGTLEKRLVDLVKWQDEKNQQKQDEVDLHVAQLQEEIVRLKNYQQELEQYQLESQRTINSLRSILEDVKKLQAGSDLDGQVKVAELRENHSIEKFAGDATKRNEQVMYLLHDLKHFPSQFPVAARKKMEDQLNILEIELMKSDQYIGNLKNELKEVKLQKTNYALMLRDATTFTQVDDDNFQKPQPNTSKIFEQGKQEDIFNEIQQLRKNNKQQHFIINGLELEIHSLRGSLDTDSDDQRDAKEEEVKRLERLVKECQGCINTLESEVDNLYAQLQHGAEPQGERDVVQGNTEANEGLDMIARELEKTVVHYQQLHAINYMMVDFMKSTSIESIAKQLVQLIKNFRAPIGFSIYSLLGSAEYFPSVKFNDSLKLLIKESTFTDPVTHLDEGTLFINSKLHVMVLPPSADVYPILETSLATLINAAEETIKRLEDKKLSKKRDHETNEWNDLTKNLLSNLDIQYAYQVEENRKTFNHFIAELRRAYHLLDLEGPGGVILDNAINEFEERVHALIHSGEVIDNDISTLLEHMAKLDVAH